MARRGRKLSESGVKVLEFIRSAGDEGCLGPPERIAASIGVCRSTVCEAINRFEYEGSIDVDRRRGTKMYKINHDPTVRKTIAYLVRPPNCEASRAVAFKESDQMAVVAALREWSQQNERKGKWFSVSDTRFAGINPDIVNVTLAKLERTAVLESQILGENKLYRLMDGIFIKPMERLHPPLLRTSIPNES